MAQTGQVVGKVEFRAGDGAKMPIPKGKVEIERSRADVTLAWVDGETHGSASMPLFDFDRYVRDGALRLLDGGRAPVKRS